MAVQTSYAHNGDISIAYQVIGDGPVDVILVNGLVAHLDLLWGDPDATAMIRRVSSFCRLILFDKPGTGVSDPVAGAPTVEQRMADVLAVMDAAGSARAFVVGYSEGGVPAVLLAATHPERVHGLVLVDASARFAPGGDYPAELNARIAQIWEELLWPACDRWGDGFFAETLSPTTRRTPVYRRLAPTVERSCASPGMVRAIIRGCWGYDVLQSLPLISMPTLVIGIEDSYLPVAMSRHMAERIPGARLVVFPGDDHIVWFGDWEALVDELEEFVTGHRHHSSPAERALCTIVFTDIAGSTEAAVRLGDERWRSLLAAYDAVVAEEVERSGGRLVKRLGDGHLAVLDRPASAIRAGRVVLARAAELGLTVRVGVHTGECEIVDEDIAGIAVHIGARVCAAAAPGQLYVSSTVRELVFGSGLELHDRGPHELKGVPGTWNLYSVGDDHRTDRVAVDAAPELAAATPGPETAMTWADRQLVAAATRAPGAVRVAMRVASKVRRRAPAPA